MALLRRILLRCLPRSAALLLAQKGRVPTIPRLAFSTTTVSSLQTSVIKGNNDRDKKGSNSKTKSTPPKSSYLIQGLHQNVCDTLRAEGFSLIPEFNKTGPDYAADKRHSTSIMAKFRCRKEGCGGTCSKKVAIRIRWFEGNTYNASVYNQRCLDCDALGIMAVDKDVYVARVVYRLKKWAGIEMEQPDYPGTPDGTVHECEHCEGCRLGICECCRPD
ncbi:zinc-binding domain-containing protein [Podospora fimiseda]|uniref:Zinc-binding domain-containing protein n=1 Tax=Podospora fimiseda TaxID=252190 RepID=A0AAN6YNT3_9PEZI|nr:zinc-binding domain-containing protein [Podospora fimiseda]